MALNVRRSNAADAAQWVDLLKVAVGEEYPDKQVYQIPWASKQLDAAHPVQTWVVSNGSQLTGSISVLPPLSANLQSSLSLIRPLFRPDSFHDGTAEGLLAHVTQSVASQKKIGYLSVAASDNLLQATCEKLGYQCAGFQPDRHMNRVRQSTLFYVRQAPGSPPRIALPEWLSQIQELGAAVLGGFQIPHPTAVRDGVVGYPLQTDVRIEEAPASHFEDCSMAATALNPPVELTSAISPGFGWLKTEQPDEPLRAIIAMREDKTVGGLLFHFDPLDRCLRVLQGFGTDDLSMGALLAWAVKAGQERFSCVYIELNALMSAPRLIKSAEQLGLVPVAYLPNLHEQDGRLSDVVKMVKLNLVYSRDESPLTTQARRIADIIDHNFEDQKVGVAIINLLRTLPIFEGLGDGELRKMARLFTQKLYRPGEKIFNKGDSGNEAYVVMRGQIDILLESGSKPIATIGNGQIFGEMAFLDAAARVAIAQATQPSILLVIQRAAFTELVQREPHLGMTVMRNIAIELSNRLRKTNAALAPRK